jgi:hypothetical protein
MRAARPIAIDLQPWTRRPDGTALNGDRQQVERITLGKAHARAS